MTKMAITSSITAKESKKVRADLAKAAPKTANTATAKVQAMLDYCSKDQCRSQQLISYFGQEAQVCGKCDVCRPISLHDENLFTFLAEPKSLQELQLQFFCSKAALESIIRPHLLTEKIKYSAGKFYL